MNTTELYTLFRQDVVDLAKPYLWTDSEVFSYMDDAQLMFARLGVGIADVTTEAVVRVAVVTGEEYAALHPSILTIRQARLASTNRPIDVDNAFDLDRTRSTDYSSTYSTQTSIDHRPGPIRSMVVGEEQDKCRWVGIPVVDDEVVLSVYRLPINALTQRDQEFEIRRENHRGLLIWMKSLAYGKQDAETFSARKASDYDVEFRAYCEMAKAEWERYKHKPRQMQYGGI